MPTGTPKQPQAPAQLRQAVLICNAKSRRGREWYPAVHRKLIEDGFELLAAHDLRDPSKISGLVKKAVADKVPLIIVGGGDGTMSACASFFKGSDSILGVLPFGTGNAFARDLGIPADVDGACQVLAEGIPRKVDLGLAGKKHFVNVVTVGLSTRIAEALDDEAKKRLGRFVYAVAIFKAVVAHRPFVAKIITPEKTETFETMQVVFGSGRFHAGPFPVTPEAEITDHYLNGYALKSTSKGSLLKYALKLWGGHHVDMPEIESFQVKSARVETYPSRRVIIDGESGARTPIDIAIDPAAIRVLVAPNFPGETSS